MPEIPAAARAKIHTQPNQVDGFGCFDKQFVDSCTFRIERWRESLSSQPRTSDILYKSSTCTTRALLYNSLESVRIRMHAIAQ